MAWNLPGDHQDNKSKPDPWTGHDKPKPEQPPHLEDLLKAAWQKCRSYLGPKLSTPRPSRHLWSWLAGIMIFIWAMLGLYHVRDDQLAYVMRLGVYQGQLTPGWQWRAFGLYQIKVLPQPMQSQVTLEVMTQDLNLAEVSLEASYRMNDPEAYLFHVQAPEETLKALMKSALQQTIGGVKLTTLLSETNPPQLTNQLSHTLQGLSDQAGLGLSIDEVNISKVAIPEALQELFNQINALYLTQANIKQKNIEYRQQVLPLAEAKAEKLLSDAKSYSQQAVNKAQADVSGFLALLPSYEQAPHLTKYRLYTDSLSTLLAEVPTVILATKGPAPVIHLGDLLTKKTTASTETNEPTPLPEISDTALSDPYANVKGGYG